MRRTARARAAPQRYEPDEMPEDDFSDPGGEDDMPGQEEERSEDSRSTGSLADWMTSDGGGTESDIDDPDWEMDSSASFSQSGSDASDTDAD